ncbi:PIG-L deacetylase family protein [Methanococcoides methylutens]|uniref:PIG-L deacetylase family protein n=1 Tax=Methanococcoides methylutens TaxID=2226 RepID=UPI0040444133
MNILVLSPHTDDAELGCGGSIAKFLEEGHDIFWVVFSTAEDSLPQNLPKDTLEKEFLESVHEIGLENDKYKIFNFKVRNLHNHRQEILEDLIQIRKNVNPDLVIGPSVNDYHQDHQVVANEMIRAFKTTSSIICYELPWNHITFNTQLFVKLESKHMSQKYNQLKHYRSQFIQNKSYFSKDFVYGFGSTRGIQCNSKYAEAFEVVRWMI